MQDSSFVFGNSVLEIREFFKYNPEFDTCESKKRLQIQ